MRLQCELYNILKLSRLLKEWATFANELFGLLLQILMNARPAFQHAIKCAKIAMAVTLVPAVRASFWLMMATDVKVNR